MIRSLRWIGLIPACIAAWYVALFIGIYLRGEVFSHCPPKLVEYGMFCNAEWFFMVERITICLGAALSAVFVVLTAALIAPSHRVLVSRLALVVGSIVAIAMAWQTNLYFALGAAIGAGAVATVFVGWLSRRSVQGNVA